MFRRRCRWGVFFSSRRRHTRFDCDWSSDVCSSDLSRRCGQRTPGRATRRSLCLFFLPFSTVERSEEHTSELQSQSNLVCRLLLEKKKKNTGSAARLTAECLRLSTLETELTYIIRSD